MFVEKRDGNEREREGQNIIRKEGFDHEQTMNMGDMGTIGKLTWRMDEEEIEQRRERW